MDKKKYIIQILFTFLLYNSYSQNEIDNTWFSNNFRIVRNIESQLNAQWFASLSLGAESDSVLKLISPEPVCINIDKNKNVVFYGVWDSCSFTPIVKYEIDSSFVVKRILSEKNETLYKYVNLIIKAKSELRKKEIDEKIEINWYVVEQSDVFHLVALPVIQENGFIIYGFEYHLFFIKETDNMQELILCNSNLLYFKPNSSRNIELLSENCEKPTVGELFFVWYYKKYFKSIFLNCNSNRATIVSWGGDKYSWGVIKK